MENPKGVYSGYRVFIGIESPGEAETPRVERPHQGGGGPVECPPLMDTECQVEMGMGWGGDKNPPAT